MRYRYLDDFRHGISVFAIFSYGIAVLGTPQCPPPIQRRSEGLCGTLLMNYGLVELELIVKHGK